MRTPARRKAITADAAIAALGGTVAAARLTNCSPPSVTLWRRRGIPAERCPAIERASNGALSCEQLRPDLTWWRKPDASWPHPAGKPLLDVLPEAA